MLVIEEYVRGTKVHTLELGAPDYKGATVELMRYLWRTATSTYAASVMLKWTEGPRVVGYGKPFDVREYEGAPGNWCEYKYRCEYPKVG